MYICACAITRSSTHMGLACRESEGNGFVQGNDWGFKKFIRRGQCDDKLTLYCKVSGSHNSWPDVSSLLLCSSCLYTHTLYQTHTHIHAHTITHAHTHIHVHTTAHKHMHTHTCPHLTHANTNIPIAHSHRCQTW